MKRRVSLALAVIFVLMSFAYPFTAYAEFVDGIEAFSYSGYSIPKYDGDIYEVINGNNPKFNSSDLSQSIYESYSALDSLGRVGVAKANIDKTLMPTGDRGDISSVYPTGWKQNKYSFVSGSWLYNRSHLIGWQLTGEDANKKNLMTGTRTFNAVGMVKFENEVAAYVKANAANNVLYRVTPVFSGDNLLANGVIMEAESVDDLGASVKFCVFVYNVEKGVSIDYATGDNKESGAKLDLSEAYIYLESTKYTYTGKAFNALSYVKLNGRILAKGKDYTVSYSNNINVGTARVTVYGINDYKGSASKTFTIAAPYTPTASIKKLKAAKKGFTATIYKRSGITGYQIQYSLKSNFKNAKTANIKASSTSKKVTKLKAKKKYYVRIRTYKTVGGKTFYSNWSKAKTIKVK